MWDITPYKSVGPIRLGESRNTIQQVLGPNYEVFHKVPGARPTDAYDDLGVHIYYDDEERVEFVELFEPAEVAFGGVALMERLFLDVDQELKRLEAAGLPVDNGYRYQQCGFALSVDEEYVDGVAVYVEGYYG